MKNSILHFLLGLLLCVSLSAQVAKQPNVILILTDDLGYNAVGCYGAPFIETPNIDRLAEGGQRWTRAYAGMATCAPSRSVLISGQYTPRTGVYRVTDRHKQSQLNLIRYRVPPLNKHLALEKVTLAEAFQNAGYRTAHFGKWHLGNGAHHPRFQGFDVAIESASKHFGFKTDPAPDKAIPDGAYLSDYLTDQALGFLKECVEGNAPFFLYLPDFLVHKPLEAKEKWESYYKNKIGNTYGEEMVTVAAMTSSLDESVGRIYAFLETSGLLEDTLIVFTSDNGGYRMNECDPVNILNLPLRSYKGQLYEGGIRVPTIFHWPEHIAGGSVCDVVLHFVDLYPTLLDLAGVPQPADYPLDGISLRDVVLGNTETVRERSVFWFFPKYAQYQIREKFWKDEWRNAMVSGRHKLIEYVETGRYELFDLEADPAESRDLSQSHPELLQAMRHRLEAGKSRYAAPIPQINPDFRP